MRIPRAVLALIAIGAMAIAAGCGGDGGGDALSLDEYGQEVGSVLTPVGSELQETATVIQSSKSPDDLASSVGQFEEQLDGGIADLEAIEPPEEVVDSHEKLITALEDINAAFGQVREAAESGDQQEIVSSATELAPALTEFQTQVNEVRTELEDAGVSFNSSSSGEGG